MDCSGFYLGKTLFSNTFGKCYRITYNSCGEVIGKTFIQNEVGALIIDTTRKVLNIPVSPRGNGSSNDYWIVVYDINGLVIDYLEKSGSILSIEIDDRYAKELSIGNLGSKERTFLVI